MWTSTWNASNLAWIVSKLSLLVSTASIQISGQHKTHGCTSAPLKRGIVRHQQVTPQTSGIHLRSHNDRQSCHMGPAIRLSAEASATSAKNNSVQPLLEQLLPGYHHLA